MVNFQVQPKLIRLQRSELQLQKCRWVKLYSNLHKNVRLFYQEKWKCFALRHGTEISVLKTVRIHPTVAALHAQARPAFPGGSVL